MHVLSSLQDQGRSGGGWAGFSRSADDLAADLAAQTLGTRAARDLLRAGTWDAAGFGGNDRFCVRRDDASVCLGLFDEETGTRDDGGSRTLKNGHVCCRLQW